ncbi:response regulator transcription factor [Belnapia rosea]|uniref:Two component transcriptional regulator, LuxR family n=1 Tax=Belnapia rosea TaxID=938405 RepID=A0A1G6QUX7_9PROT|nr:response regulator [Belnapia rosea]SDB63446.1 two component transcriptional regulator, LuxR family [Belnapia rosea]SDC95477.1 two component transcriptional regulator, LuxR family [Belnapia rosea]
MDEEQPLVLVVDDDAKVRRAVDGLLRSVGHATALYDSAQELLDTPLPARVGCIVMDVRIPRMSGLEFQARLAERGEHPPIIFITGYGDIPMSVRAMKAGAVDFLVKPFRDQDMLDAVDSALAKNSERRRAQDSVAAAKALHATLTPREQQVMALVTQGLMNKQVAGKLGLSEITVKLHRASLMRKLEVRTLADLVRLAQVMGVGPS